MEARRSDGPRQQKADASRQPEHHNQPALAATAPVLDLPLPTGNYNPLVTGLLGRVTYLGTTGKLFIEDSAWKGQLAGAGPVGRQLLERMSALVARGWSIGNLSMQDPFWKLTGK